MLEVFMTQQDMVQTVFSKLSTVFTENGLLVTDNEKAEDIAKLLGLVKGIRKVGGLMPTDEGLLFIGVDPQDLKAAKERAEAQAEIDRLEAQIAEKRAALTSK
jgi:hypothetical protein